MDNEGAAKAVGKLMRRFACLPPPPLLRLYPTSTLPLLHLHSTSLYHLYSTSTPAHYSTFRTVHWPPLNPHSIHPPPLHWTQNPLSPPPSTSTELKAVPLVQCANYSGPLQNIPLALSRRTLRSCTLWFDKLNMSQLARFIDHHLFRTDLA